MFLPDQNIMVEQVKFTYFLLEKVFLKKTKTIQEQENKQVKVLKVFKPGTHKKTKNRLKKFLQKVLEIMKLRKNQMKLKNLEKEMIELN